jgi:probable rRNA maturation factor
MVAQLQFSEQDLMAAMAALDGEGSYAISDGELSVAFVDGDTIRALHGDFLGDGSDTDVITFPGDGTENFAGEICISVECAIRNALEEFADISDELMLYLVHGWLHLAGLRDGTEVESAAMRRGELHLLNFLRSKNLSVKFTLQDGSERFWLTNGAEAENFAHGNGCCGEEELSGSGATMT